MMKRLSIPWDKWDNKEKAQQAVVVGSGYGGSVAALRLARQGWQVTLLERGGEYLPGQFPNDFSALPPYFRLPSIDGKSVLGNPSGLLELRIGAGISSLVGNGVGGGSLINAGVLMRPDSEVFAQAAWPSAIRHSDETMHECFESSHRNLRGESTRDLDNPKTRALECFAGRFAAERVAEGVDVTIDLDKCTKCGDCATGCNVEGAKLTLRDTYLGQAFDTGRVTVVTGATVYSIMPADTGEQTGETSDLQTPWILRIVPTAKIGHYRSVREAAMPQSGHGAGVDIEAALLVLSAGTLGSVEILQRSVARAGRALPVSTALGSRFSGNGDAWSVSANEPKRVNGIGLGADGWRDPGNTADHGIGPTITRMIDLRDPEKSLERRLVIEEGAIPGAIGNAYAALLTTCFTATQLGERGWQDAPHQDPLTSGRIGADGAPSLAERTQLLLTMGHDGSRGLLLWREDRDACVPYFDDPENLETYRYQEQLLKNVCEKTGSVWVPAPTWRLLPDAIGGRLSGPSLNQQMIMTVHPLGGCVMGDDAGSSVVDACGRVRIANSDDVFESLYVLDGSIVPTSLGCNPLWTITALAERALADTAARSARDRLRRATPAAANPPPPPAGEPRAPGRAQAPRLPAYLEERLVCRSLNLPAGLSARLGRGTATLEFRLRADDWMAMWDSREHRLRVEGRLVFDPGSDGNPIVYEVDESAADGNAEAQLFVADRGNVLQRCGRFVRAAFTYLIYRGNELFSGDSLERFSQSDISRYFMAMVRYFWQGTEIRRMDYRVEFVTAAENMPGRLYMRGTKHIEYAASCGELLRHVLRCRAGKRNIRPRLRDTFVEQASNLRVSFSTASIGSAGRSRKSSLFKIDFAPMIERLPLRLEGAGDLPNALVSLSEYPLMLIRYLLKTRIFDFRAPDYSGIPVRDAAPPDEITIQTASGPVTPQRIDFNVPLGLSSSDAPGTTPDREIKLTLWRYRRPEGRPETQAASWHGEDVLKVKSMLLSHAFGQSGYSFTLNTIRNPAACLYDAGFEVWVLEHRLSTRLAAHEQQTNLDQIARYDIPLAVDEIIGRLRTDLEDSDDRRLQIFSFAQCLGAAATSMALLSGQLSYDIEVPVGGDMPPLKMPKLAGLFVSQTHPHTVGQPITQAKTWLPAALRDTFRISTIPFAVRDGEPTAMEYLADRLFAALPLPVEEECPVHRGVNREDAAATCRRIRFLEAPLFRHENLDDETHMQIAQWFGSANVRTFAHAAKIVEAERLVTEDGDNAYVTDLAFHRFAGLPICYLHGEANELFHPEGAIRTARHYSRLQPGWAARVEETVFTNGRWKAEHRAGRIIRGYGHVDVLVGENSAAHIFEPIARAVEAWFAAEDSPQLPGYGGSLYARACTPATGPLVGAVKNGEIGISFRLDDRFSDGKGDMAGSRTRAFARYDDNGATVIRQLKISTIYSAFRNDTGPAGDTVAYRVASGRLPVTPRNEDLRIECLSVHEIMVPDEIEIPPGAVRVRAEQLDSPRNDIGGINDLLDRLVNKKASLLKNLELDAGKPERSVSRLRHYPEQPGHRLATVPRQSFAVLAQGEACTPVAFGAASCRYPGFRIEHRRVDRWLRSIEELQTPLAFGILLGDQIYADATGGFADPLNPTERFIQRHRFAFARSRRGSNDFFGDENRWFGDWLADLPVVMTPDDHEFHDAFPDGPPIARASPAVMGHLRQPWVSTAGSALHQPRIAAARDALVQHQQIQMVPYRTPGLTSVWTFTAGAVRVIVIDTRSHRQRRETGWPIISAAQMNALRDWLMDADAGERLSVIATGSVILPGKIPDSSPENPGREDNFQIDPATRKALFGALSDARENNPAFRFLLLSGDYHLSAQAVVEENETAVGACIVAPPLYSSMPFADSVKETIWFDEPLRDGAWTLANRNAQRGNALGIVSVEPTAGGYDINFSGTTRDPFAHNPDTEVGTIDWKCRL